MCDSLRNPFGYGMDYCRSRNHDYTLITGDRADVPEPGQPGGTDCQVDIYGRTGALVYHAADISSEGRLWNPNQTNCPAGTYYCIFTCNGEKGALERKGVVEVVR